MKDIELETYLQIFNMIPIGLGIAAMNGKLLIYNDEILKPGEYTRDDIDKLNSVVELYFDPADRAKVLEMAKKEGKVTNFKVRFKKKNGEPYYTLMSLRPVKFKGTPGWLASVLDIDEQIRAEEEVNNKLSEIEMLNKIMIGRELKMAELKTQLEEAKNQNKV